jgi:hypothetical protein
MIIVRTNEGSTSNTRIHNPDNGMLDFAGQIPVRTKNFPSHTEPFVIVDRLKIAYTGCFTL